MKKRLGVHSSSLEVNAVWECYSTQCALHRVFVYVHLCTWSLCFRYSICNASRRGDALWQGLKKLLFHAHRKAYCSTCGTQFRKDTCGVEFNGEHLRSCTVKTKINKLKTNCNDGLTVSLSITNLLGFVCQCELNWVIWVSTQMERFFSQKIVFQCLITRLWNSHL